MLEKKTVKDGRDLYRRYAKDRSTAPLPERDPKILAGHAMYDHYNGNPYTGKATAQKENN